MIVQHDAMADQSIIIDCLPNKDRSQRGYRTIQQLTIPAIHHGREHLDQIGSLCTSEIHLAHRRGRNVGVDKKGKELGADLRVDVDRHKRRRIFITGPRLSRQIFLVSIADHGLSKGMDEFARSVVAVTAMPAS